MAWEISHEELDLSEMEHRTYFIEPTIVTRSGPASHILTIAIGGGVLPHHHYTINDKGELLDNEGKIYDHRAKQQEVLKALNDKHHHARLWAQRNHIPHVRAGKK